MNPLVELRAMSDKIEVLTDTVEEYEKDIHSLEKENKFLYEVLEKRENEILRVKKQNARLRETKDKSGTFIDLESYQELEEQNTKFREALEKISKIEIQVGLHKEPSYEAHIALIALQGKK